MSGLLGVVSFNWPDFLGPFHVVMLHYPIGFLTLAVLLEGWTHWHPGEASRRAVGFALGLSVVVSWLVTGLGFFRAAHGEFDPHLVALHKLFGLGVAGLSTVTWWLHRRLYPDPERLALRRTYRGLLALSLGFLVVAGHQGGTLTHGSKFLTEGAPSSVSSLLGALEAAPASTSTSTSTSTPPATPVSTSAGDYPSIIEPLLARKCYSCHGAEKQKGRLRLDEREAILKGGASGEPAVVPGDPMRSHLVRLILLPRDQDDVMPPEGREPLTPEETLAVVHWIQAGASFGNDGSPVK